MPSRMTRRHIWLDDEVWEKIDLYYGESLGKSKAINKILAAFIANLESRAATSSSSATSLSLEDLNEPTQGSPNRLD